MKGKGGKSPEEIIEAVETSLAPTCGEMSRTIALEVVGLVLPMAAQSTTVVGVCLAAASIYIELGTAILDRTNYISMRQYFSFRWGDRFEYYMYGIMS